MSTSLSKMPRKESGFTLIELMIVVAIIGILAAVAVPQYKAYVGRSMVSEALASTSAIKTAFEEYITTQTSLTNGTITAKEIGLTDSQWQGTYLTTVSTFIIANAPIFTIMLGNTGYSEIDNKQILFVSTRVGAGLTWKCSINYTPAGIPMDPVLAKYVPSTCRSE